MSTNAENLRKAMGDSMRENATQVAITEESRQLLQAVLREEMSAAVRKGIEEAMTEAAAREFARVFMDQMQAQATTRIDNWSGGLVRLMFRKVMFFAFMGSIVYSVGGWGALAALAKWLAGNVGIAK